MIDGDFIRIAHLAPFSSSALLLTLPFIACTLNTTLSHYAIIHECMFLKSCTAEVVE